jgi:hypothetical protein
VTSTPLHADSLPGRRILGEPGRDSARVDRRLDRVVGVERLLR